MLEIFPPCEKCEKVIGTGQHQCVRVDECTKTAFRSRIDALTADDDVWETRALLESYRRFLIRAIGRKQRI